MKALIDPIRKRFALLHLDHQRIAFNAAWVAVFVLVSKVVGGARDIAIAWRYGVSELVDAYQLATTLVFWLPGATVSVLAVVLVPMLVRLRREHATERGLFDGEMLGSVLLLGMGLGLFTFLFGPIVLPYFAGKLSVTSHEMVRRLIYGMAPAVPLILIANLFAARLMANERQLNTLLEGVPAAAVLLFVLLWPIELDISPLLWGTLLGLLLQTLLLSLSSGRAESNATPVRFSRRSSLWPEFYNAAVVVAAGQFLMSIIVPLDQYSAAQLGDGAIATLGYANRLVGLLLGAGAVAISRATLPVISHLHAIGHSTRAFDISMKWARLMLIGGTLVAGCAWVLAPSGISLLLERGAFNSNDTLLVSEVFRWSLIQVPFYFAGLVLIQLLVAQGRYATIAIFAVSNLVAKIVLNWALSNWMGIAGIVLATSLVYAWSACCLYYAVLQTQATN